MTKELIKGKKRAIMDDLMTIGLGEVEFSSIEKATGLVLLYNFLRDNEAEILKTYERYTTRKG